MTPVGIAVGTIITEFLNDSSGESESALVAVLQTLASGTLLYVAFFEVRKDKKKVLIVLLSLSFSSIH